MIIGKKLLTNTDRIQAILKRAQEGSLADNSEIIWLVALFVASVDAATEALTQVSRLKQLMRDVDCYAGYDIRSAVSSELWNDWKTVINAKD